MSKSIDFRDYHKEQILAMLRSGYQFKYERYTLFYDHSAGIPAYIASDMQRPQSLTSTLDSVCQPTRSRHTDPFVCSIIRTPTLYRRPDENR